MRELRDSGVVEDGDHDFEPLHVHDLPQIYSRPSFEQLEDTLHLLKFEPPSLSLSLLSASSSSSKFAAGRKIRRRVHAAGVTSYLTSFVSSPLSWLPSDEARETIWDLAGKRLSERAGRAAAGDLVRKFRIPLSAKGNDAVNEVELILHEPSLTEDNLGLKTWASSLVLASQLRYLTDNIPPIRDRRGHRPKVLELGSGTGLLGLAAAIVWPHAAVKLTDLEVIVKNLRRNVGVNKHTLGQSRGVSEDALGVQVEVLDWSLSPSSSHHQPVKSVKYDTFDVVIAADPLYSPLHPQWLVNTISENLSLDEDARALIAYPLRKGYEQERYCFEKIMVESGLTCRHTETIHGVKEDWGDGEDDGEESSSGESVKYGVWAWAHKSRQ